MLPLGGRTVKIAAPVMKLANSGRTPLFCRVPPRARRICFGALLGVLGGLLAVELGFKSVLPGQLSDAAFELVTLGLGALVGAIGWPAIVGAVDAFLVALYVVVAFSPLMPALARSWVRADAWPGRPNAVMVLSSSVLADTAIDETALDRLLTGLEVAERDSIARFVTSRVEVRVGDRTLSSDADQQRMVALAHLAAKWDVVDSVQSTRDEALRAAKLLLPAGAKTIVVVTSPMHTRRACGTFERVGFTVYCQPAREHAYDTWRPRGPADRLAAFRSYIYERLGMVKYRTKGWLGTP
jgi:uncharacterized SAM-binding protein YcdF (DUF218 family)